MTYPLLVLWVENTLHPKAEFNQYARWETMSKTPFSVNRLTDKDVLEANRTKGSVL